MAKNKKEKKQEETASVPVERKQRHVKDIPNSFGAILAQRRNTYLNRKKQK